MLQRRRLFLEELGKALVRPQIQRRQNVPRTPASAAIVRRIQEENAGALFTRPTEPPSAVPEKPGFITTSSCLSPNFFLPDVASSAPFGPPVEVSFLSIHVSAVRTWPVPVRTPGSGESPQGLETLAGEFERSLCGLDRSSQLGVPQGCMPTQHDTSQEEHATEEPIICQHSVRGG
ncbi:hypothetical protein UPYG_G00139690 [Umbra pygmaea]|uniref:Uncharacterized protein n=1 Tax=Umbra pygmaea TaxID=75934 RepID=A0ABD0WVA1_UMBPY